MDALEHRDDRDDTRASALSTSKGQREASGAGSGPGGSGASRILSAQRTAGNRAVAGRLAGRPPVQRAPKDDKAGGNPAPPRGATGSIFADPNVQDPLTASILGQPVAFSPGTTTKKPDPKPAASLPPVRPVKGADPFAALTGPTDMYAPPIGKEPVEDMGYNAVVDELTALGSWELKRRQTVIAVEQRTKALHERLKVLTTPVRKRGKAVGRAPKPRSLTDEINVLEMTRDEMTAELDLIVEYLRTSASSAERRKLARPLTALEEALGQRRAEEEESVRQRDIGIALSSRSANTQQQFRDVVKTIESITPDPDRPGGALLINEARLIPVSLEESNALRAEAAKQIKRYAGTSSGLANDAYSAYEDRRRTNRKHPVVHGLVKFATGIDDLDPLEMFGMQQQSASMNKHVVRLANTGKLSHALNVAIGLDSYADGFAQKVGEWEAGLVRGAGRWVIALTVLKEGLTILATGGAGAITAFRVARGASLLRTTLTVGGATATAGTVGATGASLITQATSNEGVSLRKTVKDARVGLGETAAIGFAPGVTTGAKNLLGAGETAVKLSRKSRIVRTTAAEIGGGVLVNVPAAAIKGESMTDALKSTVAGGLVSGPGGVLVKDLAKGSKAVETVAGGVVGSGAGLSSGLATRKEGRDLAIGTLMGGFGGAVGPHLESSNRAALEKRYPVAPGIPAPSDVTATGGTAATATPVDSGPAAPATTGADVAPAPSSTAATPTTTPSGPQGDTVPAPDAGTAKREAGEPGDAQPQPQAEAWMGRVPDSDLPADPVGAAIGRGIPKMSSRDVQAPDAAIKGGVGVGNMFTPIKRGVMKALGRPGGGTSESVVMLDTTTGRKYLFKPLGGEPNVPYAEQRGVVSGHYAERALAGAASAGELGVATPNVRLVEINGRKGSLTDWIEPSAPGNKVMGLDKFAKGDPTQFESLQKDPGFIDALSGVQALDYLINNVDRVNNLGNYMIELTPDGKFKALIPIDQELSFTRTSQRAIVPGKTSLMPTRWTRELADRVAALHANPSALILKIRPLVGDAAVNGVLVRLGQLHADGVRRGMITPAGGRPGAGGGDGGGGTSSPLAPGGVTAPTGGPVPLAPGGVTAPTGGSPSARPGSTGASTPALGDDAGTAPLPAEPAPLATAGEQTAREGTGTEKVAGPRAVEGIPGGVVVQDDGYATTVSAHQDPGARVRIEVEGRTLKLTDIFRKSMPAGTGSRLLAEALRELKAGPGNELVIHGIINPETVRAHELGEGASQSKLGQTAVRGLALVGLSPREVRWETIRGKLCIVVKL